MQVLSPEIEEIDIESMGYKEDLQRVHDKIDRLAGQLGSRPSAPPANKWAIGSSIIGGCALFLALFVAYSNHSSADLKNQITVEVGSQLKDPLKQISDLAGDVKVIKSTLAINGIRTFSVLPQSEVPSGLPQLQAAVEIAQHERLTIPQEVVTRVQQRLLRVNSSAPDYWPTVILFLAVATAGVSPNVPPPGPHITLAQLTTSGEISDQVVEFSDGVAIENMRFVNCRIIFTEQPVKMHNVQFVNSVVEFPASPNPSPYLQYAARALLASDLKSVSLNFPQPHA